MPPRRPRCGEGVKGQRALSRQWIVNDDFHLIHFKHDHRMFPFDTIERKGVNENDGQFPLRHGAIQFGRREVVFSGLRETQLARGFNCLQRGGAEHGAVTKDSQACFRDILTETQKHDAQTGGDAGVRSFLLMKRRPQSAHGDLRKVCGRGRSFHRMWCVKQPARFRRG